ncbi:acyl carrier protein [Polynucleobacter paneuropaeus]|uniref:acyl carrier protein n=1 Tax=Polynucleobacter paneuropaeus TaxID=2527775 RepID=UPI001BFE6ABB|nr:acyl carrier protein [Polynucleobacter paneuropaeus]QWD48037.1 acyl carrier protein [Polynucleobacter paneuropaeus]QWD52913.1 acyl carrier protein [Polynucleobacter paneuropaeus]QWD57827.1 acyl carrier protein [Polynucleobacter paneuropaeus]
MSNIEKYAQVFCNIFEIKHEQLIDLSYQDIPAWDSVGHMAMIASIEEVFDVMMETDDIIDFSSYEKGIRILTEKYSVQF